MIIESCAYARAGLAGNPSDGYFGKIIAISIKNFCASVSLWESSYSRIVKYCGLFLILCAFTAVFSYNIYIQIDRRDKIGKKGYSFVRKPKRKFLSCDICLYFM